MGLLTFQIPSAVFLFGGAADLSNLMFFSFFFWRVAAIFAGLVLFTGIHGYKPRLYAFSPAQSGCQQSGATWTHCAGCYQPLIFSNSVPLFWNGAKGYLNALYQPLIFQIQFPPFFWNYLIIAKSYIIHVHR